MNLSLLQTDLPFLLDFAEERDIGKREHQEDYGKFIRMDDPDGPCRELVYVLADGIGGCAGGGIASFVAVEAFARALAEGDASFPVPERLLAALNAASSALARRKQREGEAFSSMGCTMSCAWVRGLELYYMGVGDSPIYLKRGNRMVLLNRIHNHLQDTLRRAQREGVDSAGREALKNSPEMRRCGSMLTSYLNGGGVAQVDLPAAPLPLEPGDCVLVASDGILTLPMKEIALLLRTDSVLDRTAARDVDALLDRVRAWDRPRQDNVSVGLIRVALARHVSANGNYFNN